MISGKINKLFSEEFHKENSEGQFDIYKIVIPFSRLFQNDEPTDIYSGTEKIPFKARYSDYKMILRHEFANPVNFEFKVFRKLYTSISR